MLAEGAAGGNAAAREAIEPVCGVCEWAPGVIFVDLHVALDRAAPAPAPAALPWLQAARPPPAPPAARRSARR